MHYWLMKSEPDAFSIDDLARKGVEPWDGVRNYQARNFMRDAMRVGDGVLFYHSNCAQPGVAGIAEVASAAYPDPSQFAPRSKYHDPDSPRDAPRWWLVDVRFVRRLARMVSLQTLQRDARLGDFALTRRGNRLSVLPVSTAQWRIIIGHEKDPA